MPADLEDVLATAAPLPDEEPDFQRIWRRGRRLRRRRRALVGLPLVLALVAVPLVVVGARDDRTVRFADATDAAPAVPRAATPSTAPPSAPSTPASAQATLLELAAAAAATPPAAGGPYHYLRTAEMEIRTQDGAPGHDRPEDRRSLVWQYTREQWTAADGTVQEHQETTASAFMPGDAPKWALDGTLQPPVPSELSGGAVAGGGGGLHGLADWPVPPDELRDALTATSDDGSQPETAHVLTRAAVLLRTGASPELRSALFRMLATLPRLEAQRDGADRVGRSATVISATARSSEPLHEGEPLDERIGADRTGPLQRHEYFVDPESGQLLGWRITLLEPEPGWDVEVPFLTAHATVLADGFVDSLEAALEPADGLTPALPDDAGGPPRAQYEVTERATAFSDAILATAPEGYSPVEAAEHVVTGLTAVVLGAPDDAPPPRVPPDEQSPAARLRGRPGRWLDRELPRPGRRPADDRGLRIGADDRRDAHRPRRAPRSPRGRVPGTGRVHRRRGHRALARRGLSRHGTPDAATPRGAARHSRHAMGMSRPRRSARARRPAVVTVIPRCSVARAIQDLAMSCWCRAAPARPARWGRRSVQSRHVRSTGRRRSPRKVAAEVDEPRGASRGERQAVARREQLSAHQRVEDRDTKPPGQVVVAGPRRRRTRRHSDGPERGGPDGGSGEAGQVLDGHSRRAGRTGAVPGAPRSRASRRPAVTRARWRSRVRCRRAERARRQSRRARRAAPGTWLPGCDRRAAPRSVRRTRRRARRASSRISGGGTRRLPPGRSVRRRARAPAAPRRAAATLPRWSAAAPGTW